MLEDAFVLRDGAICDALFGAGAVLAEGGGAGGARAQRRSAARSPSCGRTTARTSRARGACCRRATRRSSSPTSAIHVLQRDGDGAWRVTISLLDLDRPNQNGADMTQDTQHLEPMLTRANEGEARWWFDCLAEIKVSAEQTGGLLSIIEITEPPNAVAPLHVHHRDHEGFWVLEGDVTFEVGDATIEAHAGDFAFGPRRHPAPLHRSARTAAGCCSS